MSAGVHVNSVYTFQNPTAGGTGVGADTQLTTYPGPLDTYPTQKNYTWSFTLEKDFARQYGLRMSYLGNVGRNLSHVVKVNGCAPGPVQCLSRSAGDPTGRRWTQFDMNLGSQQANGQSEFHSVEVELQRRFSGGLFMDVNYAYARLFGQADSSDPVKNPMSHYDWGPVTDQPNSVFHWNYVYEFPFGKGRRFGSSMSGIANAVAGGWMLSGLGTWQSGPALTITTSTGQTPTGAMTNRADLVGDPNLDHSGRSRGQNAYQWFNITAFKQPAFVDPTASNRTYMFGSSPTGVLRGPSFFTYDATLQKAFAVRENWKLQFRIEIFNPFNIPMLGSPDTNVTSSTFGRIRSSYAASNGSYGPRSIQLGLRLDF
jgi:hypothetical protein